MKAQVWCILFSALWTFALPETLFQKLVRRERCVLLCHEDIDCHGLCDSLPRDIEIIQDEEAEANATLVCRDFNFIVLDHNPGIFVIDYRLVGSDNWTGATVIRDPLTYLRDLFPGKPYEYRIHRILKGGVSKPQIIGPIATFTTAFRDLREVQNVSISAFETEADPRRLKVDVSFSPSEDQNCLYEVVLRDNKNRATLVQFNEAMELRTTFGSLEFETDYFIEIQSLTYKRSESPKTVKKFRTPTCQDFHKSLIHCQPAVVKGLNATTIRRGENIFDVIVTWNTPDLIPDSYQVSLGDVDFEETDSRNVSGNCTEVTFPAVKITGTTVVSIWAVSAGGISTPIYKRLKISKTPANFPTSSMVTGLEVEATHRGGDIYDITVTWDNPKLIPDFYEITLDALHKKAEGYNISGTATEFVFPQMEIVGLYDVHIRAFSAGAASPLISQRFRLPGVPTDFTGYIIVGLLSSATVVIISAGVYVCHRHGNRKPDKSDEFHATFKTLKSKTSSTGESAPLTSSGKGSPSSSEMFTTPKHLEFHNNITSCDD